MGLAVGVVSEVSESALLLKYQRSPINKPARHFPPPWSVEDIGAAFVVRDDSGQSLAYVYFEDEPGQRSAAKLVSRGEKDWGEYCDAAEAFTQIKKASTHTPGPSYHRKDQLVPSSPGFLQRNARWPRECRLGKRGASRLV
jgi:hypothetical protein